MTAFKTLGFCATLKIDAFATRCKPLTCNDVVNKSGWHAEDADQQVTDGQVENEEVGYSAHVFAPQDDEAHHSISHHTHEEDEEVGGDEDCCH